MMIKADRSQDKTYFLFFGGSFFAVYSTDLVKSGVLRTETAADGLGMGMSGIFSIPRRDQTSIVWPLFGHF